MKNNQVKWKFTSLSTINQYSNYNSCIFDQYPTRLFYCAIHHDVYIHVTLSDHILFGIALVVLESVTRELLLSTRFRGDHWSLWFSRTRLAVPFEPKICYSKTLQKELLSQHSRAVSTISWALILSSVGVLLQYYNLTELYHVGERWDFEVL